MKNKTHKLFPVTRPTLFFLPNLKLFYLPKKVRPSTQHKRHRHKKQNKTKCLPTLHFLFVCCPVTRNQNFVVVVALQLKKKNQLIHTHSDIHKHTHTHLLMLISKQETTAISFCQCQVPHQSWCVLWALYSTRSSTHL